MLSGCLACFRGSAPAPTLSEPVTDHTLKHQPQSDFVTEAAAPPVDGQTREQRTSLPSSATLSHVAVVQRESLPAAPSSAASLRTGSLATGDAASLSVRLGSQPQHHSKPIPAISESDLQRVADLLSRFTVQTEGCSPSTIIPKAMQHLCSNLPAAWACLTGISSTGQHFQMFGAAHWHNEKKLCAAHPSFLACLGRNQGSSVNEQHNNKSKWASCMSEFTSTATPAEMGAGEVTHISNAPSLQALLTGPTTQPLLTTLAEDASDLSLLHSDWQRLVRRAALRCVINIPINSAMDVGQPDGCLTLGFQEPVVWEDQWWFRGLGLLRGWLASLLTQHLKVRDLDTAEVLLASEDLVGLARCFVHRLPEVLRRAHGAGAEVRLALVSSRMVKARVYADDTPAAAAAAVAAAAAQGMAINLRKNPLREFAKHRFAESSSVAAAAAAAADAVAMPPGIVIGSGSTDAPACTTDGGGGPSAVGSLLGSGAQRRRTGTHDSSWSTHRTVELAPVLPSSPPRVRTSQAQTTSSSNATSGPGNSGAHFAINDTSNIDELAAKAGPASVHPGPAVPSARRASLFDPTAVRLSARLSPGQRPSTRTSTYAGLMQIGGGDDHLETGSVDPLHCALARRSVTSRVISTTALWEQEDEKVPSKDGPEADAPPPVKEVDILTDGTLLANALEAGEVMFIRNMAVFMDRRRMMPHDLGLGGEQGQLGSLFLLPLVHKGRPLGGLYVLLRFRPGLDIPMSYWSDLREQMSSLLFRKLSGDLRHEWCSAFVDDVELHPAVPRQLQLAVLAAWAESREGTPSTSGLSSPAGTLSPPRITNAAGSLVVTGAGAGHASSSRTSLPPPATSPPNATSAASLSSGSIRASLAAMQRASLSHGGVLPGMSNTSLDLRSTPWSQGLERPPPNTPMYVLNSSDLPNSPGSRALADLMPKTPHHLAISRVLKLMKLHEPYVNRKDRNKQAAEAVEMVQHEQADSEPLPMSGGNPGTSVALPQPQVRRSSAPSSMQRPLDARLGAPGDTSAPPPPSPNLPSTPHASKPLKLLPAAHAGPAPTSPGAPSGPLSSSALRVSVSGSNALHPLSNAASGNKLLRGMLESSLAPELRKAPTEVRASSSDLQALLPSSSKTSTAGSVEMGAAVRSRGRTSGAASLASSSGLVPPAPGAFAGAAPTSPVAATNHTGAAHQGASSAANALGVPSATFSRPASHSGRRSFELVAELQRAGLAILQQPSTSLSIRKQGPAAPVHQAPEHPGRVAEVTIMEAGDDLELSSSENVIVAESGSVFVSRNNVQDPGQPGLPTVVFGGQGLGSFLGTPSVLPPVAESEGEASLRVAQVDESMVAEAAEPSASVKEGVGAGAGAAPAGPAPLLQNYQFWPELVDLHQRIAVKPQKAVYQGSFQGQQVVLKLLRYGRSLDRHSTPSPRHVELLQRLATLHHPSLLKLMVVYPMVFEPVMTHGGPMERLMGVQPLRGKHRLGLALLLEHVPYCVTLRQAIQRQMTYCPAPHGETVRVIVPATSLHRMSQPAWSRNSAGGTNKSSNQSSHGQYDRRRLRSSSRSSLQSASSFSLRSPARSSRVFRNTSFNLVSASRASPVMSLGGTGALGTQASLGSPQHSRTLVPVMHPPAHVRLATRSPATSRQLHLLSSPANSRQLATVGSPNNSRSLLSLLPGGGSVAGAYASTSAPRRLRTPENSSTLRMLLLSQAGQDLSSPRFGQQSEDDQMIRGLLATERTTPLMSHTDTTSAGSRALVPNMPVLVSILQQVASAVTVLHRAGLLHGELRAENVLLSAPPPPPTGSGSASGHPALRHSQLSLLSAVGDPEDRPSMDVVSSPDGAVGACGQGSRAGGGGSCDVGSCDGCDAGKQQRRSISDPPLLLGSPDCPAPPRPAPPGAARSTTTTTTAAATAAAAIAGGAFSSAGSASGSNARPSPATPPNLAPGSLTVDVQVKLKDSAMCVLSTGVGGQVSVRKMVGRRRMAAMHHLPMEVLQGQRPRRSTDVFAFGVLMWEVVTGLPAGRRTPEPWVGVDVPAWYRNLAEACWAVRPKQRPSMPKILAALATQADIQPFDIYSTTPDE